MMPDDLAFMQEMVRRRLGLLAEPGAAEVIASGARIVLLPPDPPEALRAQEEAPEEARYWFELCRVPEARVVHRDEERPRFRV